MMPNPSISYFRVRDINALAKQVLDEHDVFQSVTVRGEVSNFKRYPNALYFSIKDQDARLNVVMFLYKQFPAYLPKDGDDVLVNGQITLYVKDGSYQLNARQIERFGEGDQLLALQQLKEKLFKEGLFDASRKRPFLPYPRHLVVIAGQDSAALKDITFNMARRFPLVSLTVIPAKVQGALAVESIKEALKRAFQLNADGLILARGGGSEEDLSAFNDESLVRALASSPFPVIAAIGHEINTSLCDLVADKRASTPTAAVELITPDVRDILEDLHHLHQQSLVFIKQKVEWIKLPLQRFAQHPVIKSPYATLEIQKQKVDQFKRNLHQFISWNLETISQHALRLKEKIVALSPLNIIERGYAFVTNDSGQIVRSIEEVSIGQTIKTQLKGGMITSTIQKKTTKE